MARSVFQYEQPRCPDNWNEAERRFYNRLIETLDDIYSKYGRLDEKMLSKGVLNRIDNSTATSLEKMTADILSSGKIAADSIEATFAYLVSLSAKYGSFDFETVKNLVADAMVLEKGQADYVHITNLAATYAQAVNATIGNLVIQSSDGKYYQLDVSADGKVSASEVKPSDKEISAGETSEGKVIVGTHITAETLGTATLAATQALINMIDASRINVDTLVAREEFVQTLTANEAFVDSLVANTAFIKQLGTTTIVGDKSITMLAGEAEKANAKADNLDRLSNIEVIEGTFAQTERREGEGVRIYSEISPKQDLKWGAPWPGGGGKNLIPSMNTDAYERNGIKFVRNADGSITVNGSATGYASANSDFVDVTPLRGKTLTIKGGGTSKPVVTQMYIQCASGNVYKSCTGVNMDALTFVMPEDANTARFEVYVTNGQAPSNIVVYPQLELGSVSTSFAPYANTPPIEGWTGLDAFAGGKNLLNSAPSQSMTTSGVTFSASADGHGTVVKGTSTAAWAQNPREYYDTLSLPPGTYTFSRRLVGSVNGANVNFMIRVNGKNHDFVGSTSKTYTFEEQTEIGIFVYVAESGKTVDCTLYLLLERGSTATPYEPYQGNTYALDFGETVYGGKVDWDKGEVVVELGEVTLDGTQVSIVHFLGSHGKMIVVYRVDGVMDLGAAERDARLISDRLRTTDAHAQYRSDANSVALYANGNGLLVCIDGLTTEAEVAAWLTANPLTVVYPLAEPYTIQLTPVQIETLQGINTVYTDADGGRVEFGHSPIEDIQNAVDALEEAQAESALYLKLDAENKVVRIGQTEVTSEFDIDAYGAGVVVGGKSFSRFEGERTLIGDMEMRRPANIGGLAFDSIMT